MRRFNKILLTVLLVNVFIACENVDFGDMNANRNGAEKPATSGLLAGAIMNYATLTNRTGITIPTLMVQYQAQVTYTDEMLYAQTPYGWGTYYTGIINQLDRIIEITSDASQVTPEVLLQGSAANQRAVAQIFKAVVMKRVTDLWGDVPNDEAAKGIENVTPAYDTQESIYSDIIAWVKEGRDMIVTSEKGPTGDIIYKGNMTNWKKFANSFLMQVAMQLSEVNPALGESTFREALTNAGTTNMVVNVADEAWFTYVDLTGFRNPWNANRTADYFLTKEFTDAMKGNQGGASLNPTSTHTLDDRLKVYARSTTNDGVPYGYRDGSGAGKAQMNRNYYWNATSPLPIMTASYTYLNRAEAVAMGWTDDMETSTAAQLLNSGITKSFETLEAHSKTSTVKPAGETITGSAAAYATARLADAAGAPGMLTVIREEKWKSLYGQAFDAWSEFRRTGVPNLKPAVDHYNDGNIPTRWIYPREEATLNGSNYDAAVARLSGQDTNTSRVWWDVN